MFWICLDFFSSSIFFVLCACIISRIALVPHGQGLDVKKHSLIHYPCEIKFIHSFSLSVFSRWDVADTEIVSHCGESGQYGRCYWLISASVLPHAWQTNEPTNKQKRSWLVVAENVLYCFDRRKVCVCVWGGGGVEKKATDIFALIYHLIRLQSTVISACWATVDWSWHKEWN